MASAPVASEAKPIVQHVQADKDAVQPGNIGRELLAADDSPGEPGDVLTSRGPGLEPTWAAGGGNGSGGGPAVIDNLDSTLRNAALSANQGRVLDEMKANRGAAAASGITANGNRLLGNSAAGVGPIEEVTVGGGLSFAGGVLSADAGSGTTNLSIIDRTETQLVVASDTGSDATVPRATPTLAGLITGTDQAKLNGIAPGATANRPDSELLDLANATGNLPGAQVEGLYTASGLDLASPQRLLGRWNAGRGAAEEITVGSGLDLANGVLQATGEGGAALGTNLDTTAITATTLTISSDTGSDAVIPAATATTAGLLSAAGAAVIESIPPGANFAQSDWNAVAPAPAAILNRPDIPAAPGDIGAASQGDLDALAAEVAALPAPVQSDWNAVSPSPAAILNRPTLGTAAALDVGVANGVAPLGGDNRVPAVYLPGFVDSIVEVADYASLPATGETGILYITLDTQAIWRWGGSVFVELSPSPGSTDAVPEGVSNLYYTSLRAQTVAQAVVDEAIANLPPATLSPADRRRLDLAVLSDIVGITGAAALVNMVEVSQAEYDALETVDPQTVYVIPDGEGGGGGTGGAGTVTEVSGTAPIQVASGGTTPVVSITAATTTAAGSMSAADKAKLDGVAAGATANAGTVTSVSGSGGLSGTVTSTGSLSVDRSATDTWYASAAQGALAATALQPGANVSALTNDAGFTANAGTVTSVSGSGGLSGAVTGAGSLAVDRAVTDTWYLPMDISTLPVLP